MRSGKLGYLHFLLRSIFLAAMIVVATAAVAATERILYSFNGGLDGSNPASQLVFDGFGNAYGTTVTGGAANCGTVFKLTPTGGGQWQESVLLSFDCFNGGKNPYGGVTFDTLGNLYGTTVAGGTGGVCSGDGCGLVYELSHSGSEWTETVLYNFHDAPDASNPGSAVKFDIQGRLIGTAPDGGAYGVGAIYQLTSSNGQWTESILHDFTGGSDGALGSLGPLFRDASGNFYGVTEIGGGYSAGTVFKLARGSGGTWQFTTIYAFRGQPDAAFPYGSLTVDSRGLLYGTSYYGGANGAGAVFRIGPSPGAGGWRSTVLYSFSGSTDGANPTSTLIFGAGDRLYGTTSAGGDASCQCGVVFALAPTGNNRWTESVLHSFTSGSDGAFPYYGLSDDGTGNYLSTTAAGGTQDAGVIFEITP